MDDTKCSMRTQTTNSEDPQPESCDQFSPQLQQYTTFFMIPKPTNP